MVLLFDNYRKESYAQGISSTLTQELPIVVMTKPEQKRGAVKYQVYRRASQGALRVKLRGSHPPRSLSLWNF